jgi:hypothetical protein
MLAALFVGQPLGEKELFCFVPMLVGAAFRATLPQPDGMRQGLDLLLFPGFHNNKLKGNPASSMDPRAAG